MQPSLTCRLVDVFATSPFSGNPAGVVLGADRLSAAQLQKLALEINASETAFITRTNDLHRPPYLRWFSPATEVDFCAHATLAAAHVLAELGVLGPDPGDREQGITLETAAGELTLFCEEQQSEAGASGWWLRMPPAELRRESSNMSRTCEYLGLQKDDLDAGLPPMRTRDNDLIVFVQDWHRLNALRPDFQKLAEWSERNQIRGFCVATLNTLSNATNVHSRFFAPAVGIPEDPVTGSVHGPLAVLLVTSELVPVASGRAVLHCLQGSPGGRTGLVRVIVEQGGAAGYQATVGGQCFTTLAGELRTPAAG